MIQQYVINFVGSLQEISGFLQVSSIKLTPKPKNVTKYLKGQAIINTIWVIQLVSKIGVNSAVTFMLDGV